jgi:DNA helicase-2/ATP-dependent DNA helicase PcrA
VALTRARHTLWVSGAHWYGENIEAKGASIFFEELADWGEDTGQGQVDRGPAEMSDTNPMLGFRARFVRDWPGPALREEKDEVFEQGWRSAAVDAFETGAMQASLSDSLPAQERERFLRTSADRREVGTHLREREAIEGGDALPVAPQSISASGVIDYARCPKRFYWSNVRPLPRFSGPAARIGTEIHRWIERRAGGQPSLLEMDDVPDLTLDELAGEPGKTERLKERFLSSRFAGRTPLFTERAFLLRMGEHTVAGRIDAIFGEDFDGPWEVVDWKTGRKPEGDPFAPLQLDVYGLACLEIWRKRPEDLTLTYVYLASGEEVSHPMGDPAEVRERLLGTLAAIGEGAFDPIPGRQCAHCDFRAFCRAGTEWLAANGA